MDIQEWIKQNADGYTALSPEEINAIGEFSLLWGFFEFRFLGCKANVKEIMEKVPELVNNTDVKPEVFSDEFEYFKDRYRSEGETNQKFNNYLFHKPEKKQFVADVLKGDVNDTIPIVQSLVIIAYRLRNNLFHGEKWEYKLVDQRNNFQNASSVMIKIMDLHIK